MLGKTITLSIQFRNHPIFNFLTPLPPLVAPVKPLKYPKLSFFVGKLDIMTMKPRST